MEEIRTIWEIPLLKRLHLFFSKKFSCILLILENLHSVITKSYSEKIVENLNLLIEHSNFKRILKCTYVFQKITVHLENFENALYVHT